MNSTILTGFHAIEESLRRITGKSNDAPAVVVVLDSITDPYNVGAILWSCDQFGVSLVLLPRRRSLRNAALNETVSRASAGASIWVPVGWLLLLSRGCCL